MRAMGWSWAGTVLLGWAVACGSSERAPYASFGGADGQPEPGTGATGGSGGAAAGGTNTGGSGTLGGLGFFAGGVGGDYQCEPTGQSGLAADRSLLSLDDAERAQLCDVADDPELDDAMCTFLAIFTAALLNETTDFQVSCEEIKGECVSTGSSCSTEPLSDACDATVCDFEVCFAELTAALGDLDCSMSEAEVAQVLSGDFAQSAACGKVDACQPGE